MFPLSCAPFIFSPCILASPSRVLFSAFPFLFSISFARSVCVGLISQADICWLTTLFTKSPTAEHYVVPCSIFNSTDPAVYLLCPLPYVCLFMLWCETVSDRGGINIMTEKKVKLQISSEANTEVVLSHRSHCILCSRSQFFSLSVKADTQTNECQVSASAPH